MDVYYTGPSEDGRYTVSVDMGPGRTNPLEYEREQMVRMICGMALRDRVQQVRFFINGSEEPIQMPGAVLKRLHLGKDLDIEDLIIGTSMIGLSRSLWEKPNLKFPLREVYGEERYECPACGGHAYLGTTHLRCRCETTLPLQIHPMGVFVDLVESLRQNPKQERWFINRPWNPNRPWMSRDSIKAALGLSKEQ